MKLITTYKDVVTSIKKISMSEFNMLKNHELIIDDENEFNVVHADFKKIKNCSSVLYIKSQIRDAESELQQKNIETRLINEIKNTLVGHKLSYGNLFSACEKLISGRYMYDKEKLALTVIDVNKLPHGFWTILDNPEVTEGRL